MISRRKFSNNIPHLKYLVHPIKSFPCFVWPVYEINNHLFLVDSGGSSNAPSFRKINDLNNFKLIIPFNPKSSSQEILESEMTPSIYFAYAFSEDEYIIDDKKSFDSKVKILYFKNRLPVAGIKLYFLLKFIGMHKFAQIEIINYYLNEEISPFEMQVIENELFETFDYISESKLIQLQYNIVQNRIGELKNLNVDNTRAAKLMASTRRSEQRILLARKKQTRSTSRPVKKVMFSDVMFSKRKRRVTSQGLVVTYNKEKGIGSIRISEDKKIEFKSTDIIDKDSRNIKKGSSVVFEIETKDQKLRIYNISKKQD